MKRLTLFALMALVFASLACNVPDDVRLTSVVIRTTDPYFIGTPTEYCPGEMITLKWDAGAPPDECPSRDCQWAGLSSLPFVTGGIDPFYGSLQVLPDPTYLGTGEYWFRYEVGREGSRHHPDFVEYFISNPVPAGEPAGHVTMSYNLECHPTRHVWYWDFWDYPNDGDADLP